MTTGPSGGQQPAPGGIPSPRFRVLGPVAIAGADAAAGSPRLRRLLAALLVHTGDVVSVDRLADIVWSDAPPAHVDNAVQRLVSRLRATLRDAGLEAPVLVTRSPGYALEISDNDLDARVFERRVEAARRSAPEQAVAMLGEALALWRGPAYAEFAAEPFAAVEAARLEELRATAQGLRAEALLNADRPEEAVTLLEGLTAAQPLNERPHALLMRALHRSGRTADALAVFRRVRERLRDELGIEPGRELADLHVQLLRQEPAPEQAPPPSPILHTPAPQTALASQPTRRRGNVPPAVKHLIGREDAVTAVVDKVERTRLVTLTGTGGVGKTSLALAVARELSDRYRDGAWVFELASITRAEDVPGVVTTTLDVPQDTASSVERMLTTLYPMHALVVLDNCEHVIDGAASAVDAVLRNCPDITVLATSREPLGIDGEHIWRVPPLALADDAGEDGRMASPAVRLFVERATAAAPHFALTPGNAADVRELCRRLDGLPLAIELAAMRMPAMTPAEVVARLPVRLRFLRSTGRLTQARHQTLRAVVDWSYDVLEPAERRCFEIVSSFAGSFTAAAAEQVAERVGFDPAQVMDLLGRLVDKSLVTARPATPVTRYALLETLREYGLQVLAERGELERVQAAHAAHWLAFAEDMAARLFTHEQNEVVDAIGAEMAELRSAHAWALEHDLDLALRFMPALIGYAELRLAPELFTWAQRTLTAARERGVWTADVATAHAMVGAGARVSGDLAAARRHLETALEYPADEATFAHHHALYLLADVALFEGRLAEVHALAQRKRTLPELPELRWVTIQALLTDALAYAYGGDPDAALALARSIEDAVSPDDAPGFAAYAAYVTGEALLEHDPIRASAAIEQALDAARRGRDRLLLGVVMVSAASLRLRMDEPRAAVRLFREVMTHWRRLGLRMMVWTTLRNVVALLSSLDASADAAVLLGAITTRRTASPIYGADQERMEVIEKVLRARLGDDGYSERRAAGAGMTDDEAMRFAAAALAAVDV